MRWLPNWGRSPAEVETKADSDRRASQGSGYVAKGNPYHSSWDVDRIVRDGFEKVIWVFNAVDAFAQQFADWDVVCLEGKNRKERKRVEDPLLDLLNNRANLIDGNAFNFKYRLAAQFVLSKKGVFVEIIPSRGGQVAALNLLPPARTNIIPDPDKFIEAFEVTLGDGDVFRLPPYDPKKPTRGGVIWIRKPHPTDPYSGSTPLEAAGISIDLDFYARLYNRNFLLNDGRSGQLVAVKGGLSPEDAQELKARFSPGMGGVGRTTVIEAEAISVQDTAISPRDAQYAELRGITKEDLLMALKTPESVAGNASGRTYDNADAERENWLERNVLTNGRMILSAFEVLTEGGWDDDRTFDFDLEDEWILQRQEDKRKAQADKDFAEGRISLAEWREVRGLDPLPKDAPGVNVVWLDVQGRAPTGDVNDVAAAAGMQVLMPGGGLPPGGAQFAGPADEADPGAPPLFGDGDDGGGGGGDPFSPAGRGGPAAAADAWEPAGPDHPPAPTSGSVDDLPEESSAGDAWLPAGPDHPRAPASGSVDDFETRSWGFALELKEGWEHEDEPFEIKAVSKKLSPGSFDWDENKVKRDAQGRFAKVEYGLSKLLDYPSGYPWAKVPGGAPAQPLPAKKNVKVKSLRKGDVVAESMQPGAKQWTVAKVVKSPVAGEPDRLEVQLMAKDGTTTSLWPSNGDVAAIAVARTPHPVALAQAKKDKAALAEMGPGPKVGAKKAEQVKQGDVLVDGNGTEWLVKMVVKDTPVGGEHTTKVYGQPKNEPNKPGAGTLLYDGGMDAKLTVAGAPVPAKDQQSELTQEMNAKLAAAPSQADSSDIKPGKYIFADGMNLDVNEDGTGSVDGGPPISKETVATMLLHASGGVTYYPPTPKASAPKTSPFPGVYEVNAGWLELTNGKVVNFNPAQDKVYSRLDLAAEPQVWVLQPDGTVTIYQGLNNWQGKAIPLQEQGGAPLHEALQTPGDLADLATVHDPAPGTTYPLGESDEVEVLPGIKLKPGTYVSGLGAKITVNPDGSVDTLPAPSLGVGTLATHNAPGQVSQQVVELAQAGINYIYSPDATPASEGHPPKVDAKAGTWINASGLKVTVAPNGDVTINDGVTAETHPAGSGSAAAMYQQLAGGQWKKLPPPGTYVSEAGAKITLHADGSMDMQNASGGVSAHKDNGFNSLSLITDGLYVLDPNAEPVDVPATSTEPKVGTWVKPDGSQIVVEPNGDVTVGSTTYTAGSAGADSVVNQVLHLENGWTKDTPAKLWTHPSGKKAVIHDDGSVTYTTSSGASASYAAGTDGAKNLKKIVSTASNGWTPSAEPVPPPAPAVPAGRYVHPDGKILTVKPDGSGLIVGAKGNTHELDASDVAALLTPAGNSWMPSTHAPDEPTEAAGKVGVETLGPDSTPGVYGKPGVPGKLVKYEDGTWGLMKADGSTGPKKPFGEGLTPSASLWTLEKATTGIEPSVSGSGEPPGLADLLPSDAAPTNPNFTPDLIGTWVLTVNGAPHSTIVVYPDGSLEGSNASGATFSKTPEQGDSGWFNVLADPNSGWVKQEPDSVEAQAAADASEASTPAPPVKAVKATYQHADGTVMTVYADGTGLQTYTDPSLPPYDVPASQVGSALAGGMWKQVSGEDTTPEPVAPASGVTPGTYEAVDGSGTLVVNADGSGTMTSNLPSPYPQPPAGSTVYAHPQGKVIYVKDGEILGVWGPDGKKKSTSATAAQLAQGYGKWQHVGEITGWEQLTTASGWIPVDNTVELDANDISVVTMANWNLVTPAAASPVPADAPKVQDKNNPQPGDVWWGWINGDYETGMQWQLKITPDYTGVYTYSDGDSPQAFDIGEFTVPDGAHEGPAPLMAGVEQPLPGPATGTEPVGGGNAVANVPPSAASLVNAPVGDGTYVTYDMIEQAKLLDYPADYPWPQVPGAVPATVKPAGPTIKAKSIRNGDVINHGALTATMKPGTVIKTKKIGTGIQFTVVLGDGTQNTYGPIEPDADVPVLARTPHPVEVAKAKKAKAAIEAAMAASPAAAAPPGDQVWISKPGSSTAKQFPDWKLVAHADGTATISYTQANGELLEVELTPEQTQQNLDAMADMADEYQLLPSAAAPAVAVDLPAPIGTGPVLSEKAKAAAKPKGVHAAAVTKGGTILLPKGGSMIVHAGKYKPTKFGTKPDGTSDHSKVIRTGGYVLVGQPSADAHPDYLGGKTGPVDEIEYKPEDASYYASVQWVPKAALKAKGAVVNAPAPDAPPSAPPPKAHDSHSGEPPLLSTSGWTLKPGSQAGSNKGGLATAPDGTQYYVKVGKTPLHTENELLAARLYTLSGVAVPEISKAALDPSLGLGEAKVGIASRIAVGSKKNLATKYTDPAYRKAIVDGAAVDMWLGNWDAAGTGMDNIHEGIGGGPLRIDVGGSLMFRAQGGQKTAEEWNDSVTEVDTMPAGPKSAGTDYATVVGKISKAELAASVTKHIAPISEAQIDQLVDSTFQSAGPATVAKMKSTLKARRKDIAKRAGVVLPEDKPQVAPTVSVPGGTPVPYKSGMTIEHREVTLEGKDQWFHTTQVGALSLTVGNVLFLDSDPSAPYVVTGFAQKTADMQGPLGKVASGGIGQPGVLGKKNGTGPEVFLFVQKTSTGERTVNVQAEPPPGWAPPPPPPPPKPGEKLNIPESLWKKTETPGADKILTNAYHELTIEQSIANAYKLATPEQKQILATKFTTQAQFVSHFGALSTKWNGSSNGTPEVLALQHAIAIEFGLDDVAPWGAEQTDMSLKAQVKKRFAEWGAVEQVGARLIYQNHVNEMHKRGLTHVHVTRKLQFAPPDQVKNSGGYGDNPAPPWAWQNGLHTDVTNRPINSTAWNPNVWSGNVKIEATVPVEATFSMGKTGPGGYGIHETEVVVLGIKGIAWQVTASGTKPAVGYTKEDYYNDFPQWKPGTSTLAKKAWFDDDPSATWEDVLSEDMVAQWGSIPSGWNPWVEGWPEGHFPFVDEDGDEVTSVAELLDLYPQIVPWDLLVLPAGHAMPEQLRAELEATPIDEDDLGPFAARHQPAYLRRGASPETKDLPSADSGVWVGL